MVSVLNVHMIARQNNVLNYRTTTPIHHTSLGTSILIYCTLHCMHAYTHTHTHEYTLSHNHSTQLIYALIFTRWLIYLMHAIQTKPIIAFVMAEQIHSRLLIGEWCDWDAIKIAQMPFVRLVFMIWFFY